MSCTAYAEGEPERPTFESVHRQFQDEIFNRLLESLNGDRDDAEDATVETMLVAYRTWNIYDGPTDVAALREWLHGIAGGIAARMRKMN